MKVYKIIVLFIIALAHPLMLACQSDSLYRTSWETKIPTLMAKHMVPGLALAIIQNNQVIAQRTYGWANIESKQAVTPHTGFNIGSISKLITAVAIMQLAQEKQIDLDMPIERYLSRWELSVVSSHDRRKVTIRSLLNHTAGISVHGYPGFNDKSMLPSLEASLAGVNGPARADEKVEIVIEPQTEFKYSGGGYTILQLLIEEVSGMEFAKYITAKIFDPLGMVHTSFVLSERLINGSATPYDKNANPLPFEYFTAQAAAGLHTTLEDLSLFVNDLVSGRSLISKQTLDFMVQPTTVSQGKYGMGFRILNMGPINLVGHAGSNTGWQSAFFLDYKEGDGLIMLTNGDEGDRLLKEILRSWLNTK